METEIRLDLKKRADEEAIAVFADNLRELLLAAPLGPKRVLALDPGFRTGCKLVVLDRQGELLHHDTIYPHTGGARVEQAGALVVQDLVRRHEVEAIAVGNGTAGRETERCVRGARPAAVGLPVRDGQRVGSLDLLGQRGGPRGIPRPRPDRARRRVHRPPAADPLAELVKIDPKSIGVGQYQHDVDQRALKRSLDDTVVSCVNAVGVDLNTASKRAADLRVRPRPPAGRQHRGLPQRARAVRRPRRAAEGAAPGPQGLRAGGRLPARPRRGQPPGRQRRAPRELRRGRGHGPRPGLQPVADLVGDAEAVRRACAWRHYVTETRRPAHPARHPGRAGQARPRSARPVRGLQLRRRGSRRWRTCRRACACPASSPT